MTRPEVESGRPKTTGRDWMRTGAIVLVTIVVFWLLFRSVSFGQVFDILRSARLLPLAVGILITVTFPILSAWRWNAIMEALRYPLSFREAFTLIMACWPLATFTPSKGGDLAKAYFLRGRIPVSTVLGSVLAERLIDVLTLLGFCLVGSLIFGWSTLAMASAALLVAGILGVAILLLVRLPIPEKLRPKVERMLESLRVLIRRPLLLILVVLLTIANWLASVLQTWLFFEALGHPVPFGSLMGALPAAIFVGTLPITLMGMGTRDAALIRLLSAHAPAAAVFGVGILYSLCGYWLPGLVGIPFLRQAMRRRSSS